MGPAAAERGVVAFSREVERCRSAPLGGKARAGAVAGLEGWLEHGGARVALHGPGGRGKSVLLGAWSWPARAGTRSRSSREPPVRYGAGAYGAEPPLRARGSVPQVSAARRWPHGVEETRRDLASMLEAGRPPGSRPLVVILDGFDEAVTWTPDAAQRLLRDLGPSVRAVLSARSLEALGGLREETQVVALPRIAADEVAEAIGRRLGDLPASMKDDVARVSGGEPLLVEALLKALSRDLAAVGTALASAPVGASGVLDLCAGGSILSVLPWFAGALGSIEGDLRGRRPRALPGGAALSAIGPGPPRSSDAPGSCGPGCPPTIQLFLEKEDGRDGPRGAPAPELSAAGSSSPRARRRPSVPSRQGLRASQPSRA
ncbi:hypothetical protein BE20_13505 [Sorangium cellulosum]|nr:hypothetical protein BE20_13505 [Sorangium cellulosum]